MPDRAKGLPIATTQSPTRALVLSPNLTKGRGFFASIFSTARSVAGSRPTSLAVYSSLLVSVTVIESTVAPSAPADTTWLLVTI